jgi:hypothetical protein
MMMGNRSDIRRVIPDATKMFPNSSQRFFGILTRQERWGLSWRGRLLVILVTFVAAYLALSKVHPFLAVTDRVNTRILVVEGWIEHYALRKAGEEFDSGSYERIFTTGGPEEGSGGYTNDYNTSASVGAEALKKLGVPADLIQMAPSRVIGRDRTYSSAVALRDWFREHNISVHSMNVLTEDAHARRTQLLYQKAFGRNAAVGVIAASNPDYNSKYWWRYSDGVREVIGESIAYIYARLFFYPSTSPHTEKSAQVSRADTKQ